MAVKGRAMPRSSTMVLPPATTTKLPRSGLLPSFLSSSIEMCAPGRAAATAALRPFARFAKA